MTSAAPVEHPNARACPTALDLYLALGFVPPPFTPVEGVRRIGGSDSLVLRADGVAPDAPPTREPCEDGGTVAELERRLRDAVDAAFARHANPVLLLSGGIDSALIASLASARATSPITTVTVDSGPETAAAARFARTLGTRHSTLPVPALSWSDVVETIVRLDAPVADTMLLPLATATDAVAEISDAIVSGLGADDVFGGLYEQMALHAWALGRSSSEYLAGHDPKAVAVVTRMVAAMHANGSDVLAGWSDVVSRMPARERRALLGSTPRQDALRTWLADWFGARHHDFVDTATRFAADLRLPETTLRVLAAATEPVGIDHEEPFLAPAVAGIAGATPWPRLASDPRGKAPLRALARARLPAWLHSRSKAGFSYSPAGLLRSHETEVRTLIGEEGGLLDARLLHAWMDTLTDPPNEDAAREVTGWLWSVVVWLVWCRSRAVHQ